MNYRSVRVKWAVYVWICVSVCVWGADTEEAWQTRPLSADGGMHNSIWRQFHAVSLPLSSLFPKTDKVGFGYRGEARATSCLPSLSQQLSTPPPPHYHHHHHTYTYTLFKKQRQKRLKEKYDRFTHFFHLCLCFSFLGFQLWLIFNNRALLAAMLGHLLSHVVFKTFAPACMYHKIAMRQCAKTCFAHKLHCCMTQKHHCFTPLPPPPLIKPHMPGKKGCVSFEVNV